ncbi:hypothetical protein ACFSHT_38450 [Paraburkholderia silviterrae]|uniref:Lipoprotein n=1 Tax=Paraburkholderia silviterrae TaxID=2528715 RepID=A0A4R5LZ57_9BURK|nr:hypothetical protein [Paraburkholderia silviterrae]TDG17846.1 hypothetical protein EYW47_36310 [Paraburkholderia silviterrae]
MKSAFSILSLMLMTLVSCSAFSKVPSADAYAQCMNRTKLDRLNCQAGCGMIVQQCYDEGVADINSQIAKLNEDINIKNGAACASFVVDYLSEAARMEVNVGKQASNLVGWVGSEMALNFARQRLDNILLIQRSCRTQ